LTPILCPQCGQALVKPTTVLFGRSLPEEFYVKSKDDLPTLDVLIVAGTSLVVAPTNSLVYRVPEESTMRVVVNTKAVGQELGSDFSNPKGASFCNSLRNWGGWRIWNPNKSCCLPRVEPCWNHGGHPTHERKRRHSLQKGTSPRKCSTVLYLFFYRLHHKFKVQQGRNDNPRKNLKKTLKGCPCIIVLFQCLLEEGIVRGQLLFVIKAHRQRFLGP
jgi:hypothetical protein